VEASSKLVSILQQLKFIKGDLQYCFYDDKDHWWCYRKRVQL